MEKELYTKDGFVNTRLNNKVIHVEWKKLFDADVVKSSCLAQLKAVQAGEAEVILIDVAEADGTPSMEVQEWFGSTLFPGFEENSKFKGLINVLPKNAITKMGAKRWQKTASSGFSFEIYETDSLDSAKELAKNLCSN